MTTTSFFPDPDVLSPNPNRSIFNSYSRALYWAFVNLSGIGGVESVPGTSLECWLLITVHMIGAIFYAIVTGHVINVLEEASDAEDKLGSEICRLSRYLRAARIPQESRGRIVRGYMKRNVQTAEALIWTDSLSAAAVEGRVALNTPLEADDEVFETLPSYLRTEVSVYARAETMRRQNPMFAHVSSAFLVGLSGGLSRTRTLLTGDYLFKTGESYAREIMVVESGMLQVRQGPNNVKRLTRGDCIDKSFLVHHETSSECSDTTRVATMSIRALTNVVLTIGYERAEQLQKLEASFPVDFKMLRAEDRVRKASLFNVLGRKAMAMRSISKLVCRFKERKEERAAALHVAPCRLL